MKRLIAWLRKIWSQSDKLKHVIAGMIVVLIADVLAGVLCTSWVLSWVLPIMVSALAGGLKELYDSTGRGTVDVDDFWATILGGTVVWTAVVIKMFFQIIII